MTAFPSQPQKRMGAAARSLRGWRGLEETLGCGIDSAYQAIGQKILDGRYQRFLWWREALGQIILDRQKLRGKSLCLRCCTSYSVCTHGVMPLLCSRSGALDHIRILIPLEP